MARKTGGVNSRTASALNLARLAALTVSTALTLQNDAVTVDTTGAPVDLTLPAASDVHQGTTFTAILIAGANLLRFVPAGADTINGVGAAFGFQPNGISAGALVSDGISAWRLINDAGASTANPSRLISGLLTILAGTAAITSANLGAGSLAGKPVVCSLSQPGFDATAVLFRAQGNAGGTVTITSSVNATANTVLAFIVDAR